MNLLIALMLMAGAVPLATALRARRHTTLRQPLVWAFLAWASWTTSAGLAILRPGQDELLAQYLALCLTGCAGVAVLGARRPGVGAWNFVVGGLLSVLLLPVLNGLGELRLEAAHRLFLIGTLAVALLNYLPTRLGPAALVLAAGCAMVLYGLPESDSSARSGAWGGTALVGLAPWLAWLSLRLRRNVVSAFDRTWLGYRDGYGFVWGQRMREQFNRAAHHAGWPVVLRWRGLQSMDATGRPAPEELVDTLRAVLKRFGSADEPNDG